MHFPTKKELLVLTIIILAHIFFQAFKLNGDCFWGYPITENIASPSLYPTNDLVVNSGSGNFLFYKLMAYFPFFRDNFVLRDFILSVPLTLLLLFAWYNIFRELTEDRRMTVVAVFFLLFTNGKLFLHGYPLPFWTLTSLGAIHFLQVFGFWFFLRKRYFVSFALLALSSYVHPAAGLVILGTLGIVLTIDLIKKKEYGNLAKIFGATFLMLLPNFILITKNLGANADVGRFFDIFYNIRSFAAVFVEDYLFVTYPYSLSALALGLFVCYKDIILIEHKKLFVRFTIISLFLSALWLLDFYFLRTLSIFYTVYIGRIFYFIVPLLILIIVLVAQNLFFKNNIVAKILSALLLLSLITFSASAWLGAVIILLVLFYYLFEKRLVIFDFRLSFFEKRVERFFLLIVAILLVVSAVIFGYARNNKFLKVYRFIKGENTFNFSFNVNDNYQFSRTNPKYSELLNWAKTVHGKMFIIPLGGDDVFDSFRYLTKNGDYTSTDALGQLAYNPKAFLEGYGRLEYLGVRVKDRGFFDMADYDYSDYDNLDLNKIKNIGVDYIIFDKNFGNFKYRSGYEISFENDQYVVYKIK